MSRFQHSEGFIPILRIRDARASVRYYTTCLDFTLDWMHRFRSGFPMFVSLKRGSLRLFLSEHDTDGQPGAHIYVFVEDPDHYHALWAKRGATIVTPPTDMPWGTREFHVSDPDGNIIRLGKVLEPSNG